jgi:hypothetical protein
MRADTGQDVDYLIDFHSTVNPQSIPYHHGLIRPEWQLDRFWLGVLSREPRLITGGAALVDFTAAKFGRDELNAEFSATFETEFVAGENIDRFLNLGRNFGLAWHDVFFVEADLNYDGVLNGQDWLLFIAGAETDMAGLSNIERYDRGDLDGDGKNSILDFLMFKQLFIEAHGAAAFAAMIGGVPESSAATLAVFGGCALILGITRSHRQPIEIRPLTARTEG